MGVFEIAIVLSALLCSLVAGFLFAYATVIMPGIKSFDDKQFIQTFQITDRIIQNNQPLFILVWGGSVLASIVCVFSGFGKLHGIDFLLLILSTFGYLIGVQGSTIIVHLPLNNTLQKIDADKMNKEELRAARIAFEPRWNKSNQIRTAIACCASLLLIILVFRQ